LDNKGYYALPNTKLSVLAEGWTHPHVNLDYPIFDHPYDGRIHTFDTTRIINMHNVSKQGTYLTPDQAPGERLEFQDLHNRADNCRTCEELDAAFLHRVSLV
jgi:hypothetical protein